MPIEIPDNANSNEATMFLTGFVGLWYDHSLGIAITQKFSKYNWRYKFLKGTIPTCFQ